METELCELTAPPFAAFYVLSVGLSGILWHQNGSTSVRQYTVRLYYGLAVKGWTPLRSQLHTQSGCNSREQKYYRTIHLMDLLTPRWPCKISALVKIWTLLCIGDHTDHKELSVLKTCVAVSSQSGPETCLLSLKYTKSQGSQSGRSIHCCIQFSNFFIWKCIR